MAKKICIDAGHYGKYNRSPAVKEYYESDMNWKLHLLLKKHLEAYGFEVITTRPNQKDDLTLYKRGATSKGCDLFLSIHSNAVGSYVSETVDAPAVYVPLSGNGDKIGKLLADCIASTMGTTQKGRVKTRKGSSGGEYYGVIRGAVAVGTVGLLVEHSYHTNTRSTKWLMDEGNLDKLAKAEAAVIAEYFGLTAKESATESTKPAGSTAGAAPAKKVEPARSRDGALTGVYKTTANLNMRTGAGTDRDLILTIPKGQKVNCYGYYTTAANGVKWFSVVYNGMTGFCSSDYLKK